MPPSGKDDRHIQIKIKKIAKLSKKKQNNFCKKWTEEKQIQKDVFMLYMSVSLPEKIDGCPQRSKYEELDSVGFSWKTREKHLR